MGWTPPINGFNTAILPHQGHRGASTPSEPSFAASCCNKPDPVVSRKLMCVFGLYYEISDLYQRQFVFRILSLLEYMN